MKPRLLLPAAFGLVALLVWGVAIEPRTIEVTELRLNVRRSTPETMAVISDLHLAGFGTRERKLLELLRQRQPDVVILLGDVVDSLDDFPALEQFLGALPSSRRLAVLGNWERWSGIELDLLRNAYSKHSVQLLINDCRDGIVGLDDNTAGRPDLEAALAKCRSGSSGVTPFLLLQHSPEFFDNGSMDGGGFSLSLSGHTHGGQVALFGWPLWTPPGSGPFVAGEYATRFGRLYVTRGIGTSLIPIRIGARPEVVFVTTS